MLYVQKRGPFRSQCLEGEGEWRRSCAWGGRQGWLRCLPLKPAQDTGSEPCQDRDLVGTYHNRRVHG